MSWRGWSPLLNLHIPAHTTILQQGSTLVAMSGEPTYLFRSSREMFLFQSNSYVLLSCFFFFFKDTDKVFCLTVCDTEVFFKSPWDLKCSCVKFFCSVWWLWRWNWYNFWGGIRWVLSSCYLEVFWSLFGLRIPFDLDAVFLLRECLI